MEIKVTHVLGGFGDELMRFIIFYNVKKHLMLRCRELAFSLLLFLKMFRPTLKRKYLKISESAL